MSKENFIVVGYYTDDTFYVDEAAEAALSLENHNVPWYMERIENKGNWYKNTNYKPTFLLKMFDKFKDDYNAIVYVDVDARFKRYPDLFDTLSALDVPIAVHNFDRRCYKNVGPKEFEVLSGTIYLQTTNKAKLILEKWEAECQHNIGRWDQMSLEKVLEGTFHNLPYEYCMIFDRYTETENPVIVHYQASRKVRANGMRLQGDTDAKS